LYLATWLRYLDRNAYDVFPLNCSRYGRLADGLEEGLRAFAARRQRKGMPEPMQQAVHLRRIGWHGRTDLHGEAPASTFRWQMGCKVIVSWRAGNISFANGFCQ
jgi:hypothetical protein